MAFVKLMPYHSSIYARVRNIQSQTFLPLVDKNIYIRTWLANYYGTAVDAPH